MIKIAQWAFHQQLQKRPSMARWTRLNSDLKRSKDVTNTAAVADALTAHDAPSIPDGWKPGRPQARAWCDMLV